MPHRPLQHIEGTRPRQIYQAILLRKLPSVSSQKKWNNVYPTDQGVTTEYWKDIYVRPYHTTRDTKLQAFQFKLVHHTIPCNKYLCNIKIKQSDACSFCDPQAVDTLQHFFFSCSTVTTFWKAVCNWLASQADFHVNVDEREFLFGVPKGARQARAINFTLLFTKHFIYRQKRFCQGTLELTHYLRELKGKLDMIDG